MKHEKVMFPYKCFTKSAVKYVTNTALQKCSASFQLYFFDLDIYWSYSFIPCSFHSFFQMEKICLSFLSFHFWYSLKLKLFIHGLTAIFKFDTYSHVSLTCLTLKASRFFFLSFLFTCHCVRWIWMD